MSALRQQMIESLRAFAGIYGNKNLRRLQYAWIGASIGTWAYSIALIVFAYRHGGAAAAGLIGLIRWFPAAAASPFAGVLGDRFPRLRVMIASDFVRALALLGAAGLVAADMPPAIVYVFAVIVTVAGTAFQPAEAGLLPTLAETPEQLTAANVASTTIESAGYFVGPALGGLVLAVSNVETVFVFTAVLLLWSVALLGLIRLPAPEEHEHAARPHWRDETLEGFRVIARDSKLRLLVALFTGQSLVYGALVVLITVASIRTLGLGAPGVGYLNAALGVGGLLGGLGAVGLVGSRRLATIFGLGLVFWGGPILLIGVEPAAAAALVLIALCGLAMAVSDVAGFTLLQRIVPEQVLSRVFGVLHGGLYTMGGVGAILAPLLVSWLGIRGALIVTGAILPVVVLPAWGRLAAIDHDVAAPSAQLARLRAIPMFAPLPPPTLEQLARELARVGVRAGETVVQQGAHGDRFYIVDDGELEVDVDGRETNVLSPGDHFGEIALLRDIPRTATVKARTDAELYALERDAFLTTVTGHDASSEAAEGVVVARLGLT